MNTLPIRTAIYRLYEALKMEGLELVEIVLSKESKDRLETALLLEEEVTSCIHPAQMEGWLKAEEERRNTLKVMGVKVVEQHAATDYSSRIVTLVEEAETLTNINKELQKELARFREKEEANREYRWGPG